MVFANFKQGANLPAFGQHMPAQGDRLSTCVPEPPDFIGKPCVKPQQVGMQAPGLGGYGGCAAAAEWHGNPIMMDGNEPLTQVRPFNGSLLHCIKSPARAPCSSYSSEWKSFTPSTAKGYPVRWLKSVLSGLSQVQLAAYLAGFKHALSQRAQAARGSPQPQLPLPLLQPQPQLNQGSHFPMLYQALAQQQKQPVLYGVPVTQQAWPADLLIPQGFEQCQDVSSCPFVQQCFAPSAMKLMCVFPIALLWARSACAFPSQVG